MNRVLLFALSRDKIRKKIWFVKIYLRYLQNNYYIMASLSEINLKIKQFGLKKGFVAKKAGLTNSELSHLLSNRRQYPKERARLEAYLGLSKPQNLQKPKV